MQFCETFHAMGTEIDVVIEANTPPIDAFLSEPLGRQLLEPRHILL